MKAVLLGSPDRCYYCEHIFTSSEKRSGGKRFRPPLGFRTIDHVIPRKLTKKNPPFVTICVCACYACNSAKGDLPLPDFIDLLIKKFENQNIKTFKKIDRDVIPIVVQNTSLLMSWISIGNFT